MDEQLSENQFISLLGKEIGQFPSPLTKIEAALGKLSQKYPFIVIEDIRGRIIDINREAIEHKFILMMQDVFKAIEAQLPNYRKYQSISYLDPIIRKHLDPAIYHKGYRLHKSKDTPMSGLLEDRDLDITNKFFTELFDIMNELLLTMKIYYEYERDQQISQALYQSISLFAEENEQSFIVNEGNRLTKMEEQRMSTIKEKKDKQGPAPYDVLVDVLSAVSKDQEKIQNSPNQSILGKSMNLVGVFYKYAISPTVSTAYSKIKSINPFATGSTLSSEEEQALKLKLLEHLKPNYSIHEPLDQKIVTMLIKILPLDSKEIILSMSLKEKQEFTNLITDVLSTFQNPSGSFTEIVKEIMELLDRTMEIDVSQSEDLFEEVKESKWLILFYKAFQQSYNPQRRRVLYNICQQKEIKERLLNPFAIIKLIQSEVEDESEILRKLRALPVSQKSKNPEKMMRLSMKQKTEGIWLDVEHELNRIHLYELKKKHKKIPLIEFDKLTVHSHKKVITFLFSGFMSQDTCKVLEWEGILDTVYDSQVYSVRWESETYSSLMDYAISGAKDIAEANLKVGLLGTIGGPYLRAAAILRELYKKYNSNPFNPAFESAVVTGEFLGEFIINNFKGHFINLVGFSLGTELIKNVLKRLESRQCLNMINKVYLMGGAADKTEYQEILKKSKVPLNIINLHSDNDGALKYMLRICKPNIRPIGIHPIQEVPGHLVLNQDCTSMITGHMNYRENMKVLAKLLNMKDD